MDEYISRKELRKHLKECCDDTGGVVANAVNLSNGDIKEFAITQSVIFVGAELLINE